MRTELATTLAGLESSETLRIVLSVATEEDHRTIYRLRHDVYARELGQHQPNNRGLLTDQLDGQNVYLAAKVEGRIAGFVSITLPGIGSYSMDKYIARRSLPFPFDDGLFEIRLLTVLKPYRGSELATLLMYGAFRWVEAAGGTRIMAIGRREVVDMYLRGGLRPVGVSVRSGAVTFDVLEAPTALIRAHLARFRALLERLEINTRWELPFTFHRPASCFHGGQFFSSIGPRFDQLSRRHEVINADVLDAWFPPAPGVLAALQEHADWLLRTSPPTACEGLVETIASARGVAVRNILPGAGSSDLIFRAFLHWLSPGSHVLLLDPTYGEYAHVLENVIGCTVDRLQLRRQDDYDIDLDRLAVAVKDGYDLVVLVNPNSPTGRHVPRVWLEKALRAAPARTRIWLDETYVEYAGEGESLEHFAVRSANIIVCKSMSKVYALSGARVAYVCAAAHQLEALRAITPPWAVSLIAQVAAVRALQDPAYYRARYAETIALRTELAAGLEQLGLNVIPGIGSFVLCHIPNAGPDAATVVQTCAQQGVFLRNAGQMGTQLGDRALRVAVKDRESNRRILETIARALRSTP